MASKVGVKTYATPVAFRAALETRLRQGTSGAGFQRRRQILVFGRFLARVIAHFQRPPSAKATAGRRRLVPCRRTRATGDRTTCVCARSTRAAVGIGRQAQRRRNQQRPRSRWHLRLCARLPGRASWRLVRTGHRPSRFKPTTSTGVLVCWRWTELRSSSNRWTC